MAFNGSGVHNRVHDWTQDLANTVPVTASRMDAEHDDISSSLSNTICRDGQSTTTARIPFASGVSVAAGTTSSVGYAQTGDLNTGLYFPGSDQWGLVAGGTAILTGSSSGVSVSGTLSANGSLSIGGSATLSATLAVAGDITHHGQPIVPVGTVVDFAGASVPNGWLLCYGQAISRTTYSALFAALGTVHGTGDGSTTFNLPDSRGRVVAGKDDMGGISANRLTNQFGGLNGDTLGASGGSETHTLAEAELAAHDHDANVTDPGHTHTDNQNPFDTNVFAIGGGGPPTGYANNSGSQLSWTVSANTTGISVDVTDAGSGQAHNNVQPTLILNKMIFTGIYL